MQHYTFTNSESQTRTDQFLTREIPELSRTQLQNRIVNLRINKKPGKLSRILQIGDTVEFDITPLEEVNIEAENLSLEILFESKDVLIINKPRGLVVHPGAGNKTGTLVSGLMHHTKNLADDFEHSIRPGIVHRLDKETSGIIITSKNQGSHEFLANQFRDRTTTKVYLAVCHVLPAGKPRLSDLKAAFTLNTRIGRDPKNRQRYMVLSNDDPRGKEAVSVIKLVGLSEDKSLALFKVRLNTGRTHQIRVHLGTLGFPIVGDPMYGIRRDRSVGQPMLLHAHKLTIILNPEEEANTFEAPIPDDMKKFIMKNGIVEV